MLLLLQTSLVRVKKILKCVRCISLKPFQIGPLILSPGNPFEQNRWISKSRVNVAKLFTAFGMEKDFTQFH